MDAIEISSPPAEVNGRISLYKGPLILEDEDAPLELDGEVFLSYSPIPTVRFTATGTEAIEIDLLKEHCLRLPCGRRFQSRVTRSNRRFGDNVEQLALSGRVHDRVDPAEASGCAKVQCLVFNYPEVNGRVVQYGPSSGAMARVSLESGPWLVNIDRLRDSGRRHERLKDTGGHEWTAIAEVRRSDGKPFSVDEYKSFAEAIRLFLSFATGRWVGLALPAAYDDSGVKVWEEWACQHVATFKYVRSWASCDDHECFELPFPQFCEMYADRYWQDILKAAIHWYIEANSQSGAVEGSIALTQTALELLAAVILVEKDQWVSSFAYDKLPAGDRFRLLLRWAGIPSDVPPELRSLHELATEKTNNWLDAAHALAEIRNAIIHPTKINRSRFHSHGDGARVDAWQFGLWVVELVLLRLCGYKGKYVRRTNRGSEAVLESVPWA